MNRWIRLFSDFIFNESVQSNYQTLKKTTTVYIAANRKCFRTKKSSSKNSQSHRFRFTSVFFSRLFFLTSKSLNVNFKLDSTERFIFLSIVSSNCWLISDIAAKWSLFARWMVRWPKWTQYNTCESNKQINVVSERTVENTATTSKNANERHATVLWKNVQSLRLKSIETPKCVSAELRNENRESGLSQYASFIFTGAMYYYHSHFYNKYPHTCSAENVMHLHAHKHTHAP